MSDEVLHVRGLRETQRALYSYSQQMGDRVTLAALRQGANYVKRFVQAAAPVLTGKLRRGFRVSRSKIYNGRSNEMIGVFLTLRKGKDAPFYGRFINDGWRAGNTRIAGRGFVQRGYTQGRETAVQLIIRSAEAGAAVVKRRLGFK